MKNYFKEIEKKLGHEIKFEKLEIVDNSHKHVGHKFFNKKKLHLQLKIKSLYLNSLSKINAHKIIMKILKKDLRDKIHALEISIEK